MKKSILVVVCAALLPLTIKAVEEKPEKSKIVTYKVLKGFARDLTGKRYSTGQVFSKNWKAPIFIEPVSVVEITGTTVLPEGIIIRNCHLHGDRRFSLADYLKKNAAAGRRRRKAYAVLKSILLPEKYYYVCRPEGKIKIDGKLDEKAWKSAVPMPLFTDLITGKTPRFAATCKALWDDKILYLGYRIEDPCIWARANTRDEQMYSGNGGNNGNFVKFFADPDCDGKNYVEIHVNPLNNIMDAWLPYNWRVSFRREMGVDDVKSGFLAIEWDCKGLRTAVDIHGTINKFDDVDEFWSVEMAIPFAALKRFDSGGRRVPPVNNTKWLVHVCRRYRLTKDAPKDDTWYFAWPEAGVLSTHRISKYGYFIFRDCTWRELLSGAFGKHGDFVKEMVGK